MSDATKSTHKNVKTGATIRPEEAEHFGKLAAEWWNPKGSSAMLHKLNPVRLGFVRRAIDSHWTDAAQSLRPLVGKRVLDVGCGAGLLSEPLARLGGEVTGVDAAAENVAAAAQHALGNRLSIDYRCGEIGALQIGTFDLICAMEVMEHVADKDAFVAALSAKLNPGGLIIMSTPNRTEKSRLFLVDGAETLGLIPRGTHHWDDFVTPDELTDLLAAQGFIVTEKSGIAFSLSKGLHLSADESLNFILSAVRG